MLDYVESWIKVYRITFNYFEQTKPCESYGNQTQNRGLTT